MYYTIATKTLRYTKDSVWVLEAHKVYEVLLGPLVNVANVVYPV
jgi:hypothetical protein